MEIWIRHNGDCRTPWRCRMHNLQSSQQGKEQQVTELDKRKAEIADATKDIADYFCSRGDSMHKRPEIEDRARRTLYALEIKGWSVTKKNSVGAQTDR